MPTSSAAYLKRCTKLLFSLSVLLCFGCDSGPLVVPVEGKVLYNGEPLPYGNISFQPTSGQAAGGLINPDGTFRMSTFAEYDGAIVGSHKVKFTCYTSQRPSQKGKPRGGNLGEFLIPKKYAYFNTSGLAADVEAEGNEPFLFELTGPKRKFPE